MLVKTIVDEDFINYKKPSMFISSCFCDWKCCVENNLPITICQNESLSKQINIEIPIKKIYQRYINNKITTAIIFGGLEPFLQFDEIIEIIKYFRNNNCNDDIVIYTGYYRNEIQNKINQLKQFINIIIKFGRYIPNQKSHYDKILGIKLASNNQYAEKIS